MARIPVSAGNWKMNTTAAEFEALAGELRTALVPIQGVERVVCPPAPWLTRAAELFAGTGIGVGAQNCHWEDRGAFTGEISPLALQGIATYVIVGHSERRAYFGETDETVNRRTAGALRNGLQPIVCIGETLEQREGGDTETALARQVAAALAGIDLPDGFILAYEPVWAIGTGRAATPEMANAAIAYIRGQVKRAAGGARADATRILYGGSVTAANAADLMAQPELDGALVGGASLKAADFAAITSAIAAARA